MSDFQYDYVLNQVNQRIGISDEDKKTVSDALHAYDRMEKNVREARKLVDQICMRTLGHPLDYTPYQNGKELRLDCPICGEKDAVIYARLEDIDSVTFGLSKYQDGHCEINFDDSNIEGTYVYCCDTCGEIITTRLEYLELLVPGRDINKTFLCADTGDTLFDVYKSKKPFVYVGCMEDYELLQKDVRAYSAEDAIAKAVYKTCKDVQQFVCDFQLDDCTCKGFHYQALTLKQGGLNHHG